MLAKVKEQDYYREYRERNKEKLAASSKLYREKNKERLREKHRKYYAATKATRAARTLSYINTPEGRAREMYKHAKRRSANLGWSFDLDFEWVLDKVLSGCELSGLAFTYERDGSGKNVPLSPSIDRVDSSKGYTKDNCRVIVWALNAAFNSWGKAQFKQIVSAWLSRDQT
jgi:hypothetical protein